MSPIELTNNIGLLPREALLPDAAPLGTPPVGSGSFDDHLQRAQSRTADAVGGSAAPTAAPSQKPSEPPTRPDSQQPASDPNQAADKQPDERSAASSHATDAPAHAADSASANAPPADAKKDDSATAETAATRTKAGEDEQAEAAQPGAQTRKEKKPRGDANKAAATTQADPNHKPTSASAEQTDAAGNRQQGSGGTDAAAATHLGCAAAQAKASGKQDLGKTVSAESDGSGDPQNQPLSGQPVVKDDALPLPQKRGGNGRAPSRSAAEAKPSGHANHGAADDSAALAAHGVQETAAESVAHGPQTKLQGSQVEGSRRPSRREKQQEQASKVSDQAAPEQTSPDVDTTTATTAKLETPAAAGTEIVSAVKQEKEAAAEAIKPASGEHAGQTAGKQPMVAAREAAGAQPRPASSAPSAKANDLSPADQARFVGRVAKAFQSVGDRGGAIRLRLSPPELGALRVEILVRGGVMTARLEAENHTTRNLLLDNLPALRDRLAQQDLKIERFDVGLMDHSSGGLPGHTANSATPDNRGGNYYAPQGHAEPTGEPHRASDPGAARRPGEGSHLNVIV